MPPCNCTYDYEKQIIFKAPAYINTIGYTSPPDSK